MTYPTASAAARVLSTHPTVADLAGGIDDALDDAEYAHSCGDLPRCASYIETALLLHRAMRRLERATTITSETTQ